MHCAYHAENRRRWGTNRPGSGCKHGRYEQGHGPERPVRTDEAATRTGRNVPSGANSDASCPHVDPSRSSAVRHQSTSNRSISTCPTAPAAASPTNSNPTPTHSGPTGRAKRAGPALQLSQSSRKILPAPECLRATTISTGKHSHYRSTGSATTAAATTSPTADPTGSTHAARSATDSSGPGTSFPPTPAQTTETKSASTATPSGDEPQGIFRPRRPPAQQLLRIQHQHLQGITDGPVDSGHPAVVFDR